MRRSKSLTIITYASEPEQSKSQGKKRNYKTLEQQQQRSKLNRKSETEHNNSSIVTEKNFDRFKWNDLESLHIIDVLKEAKFDKIEKCSSTLTYAEFKTSTVLKNVINVLQTCPNLQTLVFTNVILESLTRAYGNFQTCRVKKIIFNGTEKLTRDELHIINFFTKRVNFIDIQSIFFGRKKLNGGAEENLRLKLKNNKPSGPVNDVSNCVTSSILANFLVKCCSSLKILVVNRAIVLFSSNSEFALKANPILLKLDKLKLNMHCPGFYKLINSQKQLNFLDCQNRYALPPYEFEAVIVCLQRCGKTLQTVQLNHKFEFITDSKYIGELPATVVHDCKIYAECRKLQHLRLILSRNRFYDNKNVTPCCIAHIWEIPRTLVSFILHFDQIKDEDMTQFASTFQNLTSMEFLSLVGNPQSPFLFRVPWIQHLITLPHLFLFHLQNYRLEARKADMEAMKAEYKGKAFKFILTKSLCVFRKMKFSSTSRSINDEFEG